jgi:hypothetical protein
LTSMKDVGLYFDDEICILYFDIFVIFKFSIIVVLLGHRHKY